MFFVPALVALAAASVPETITAIGVALGCTAIGVGAGNGLSKGIPKIPDGPNEAWKAIGLGVGGAALAVGIGVAVNKVMYGDKFKKDLAIDESRQNEFRDDDQIEETGQA